MCVFRRGVKPNKRGTQWKLCNYSTRAESFMSGAHHSPRCAAATLFPTFVWRQAVWMLSAWAESAKTRTKVLFPLAGFPRYSQLGKKRFRVLSRSGEAESIAPGGEKGWGIGRFSRAEAAAHDAVQAGQAMGRSKWDSCKEDARRKGRGGRRWRRRRT